VYGKKITITSGIKHNKKIGIAMRKYMSALLLVCCLNSTAQQDTAIERIKKNIAKAADIGAKLDALNELANKYNLEKPKDCQETIDKMIYEAEASRNREMMARSRRFAANLYAASFGLKEHAEKSKIYAEQALAICQKEGGMLKEKVLCHLLMGRVLRNNNKFAEARKFNEQAISYAADTEDDSLKVITRLGYGRTLLNEGEKLEAFKNYLAAQTIAEKSKHQNKDWLQVSVNNSISSFYSSIEDYDKAIDYQYKYLAYSQKKGNNYDMLSTYAGIGSLYMAAKKNDAARKTYEELIRLADSLHQEDFVIAGQAGIVNVLLEEKSGTQSLQYLRAHPEIRNVFEKYNLMYQLDFGMGQVFTTIGQYDSAAYYFDKSLPLMEQNSNAAVLPNVYLQYGKQLFESGNYTKATTYLQKARVINDSTGSLHSNLEIYEMLDSCYLQTGDFKNALLYSNLHKKLKAEIDEKSKAKDILALEIDAENKRKERVQKEEEEATKRRHSLQYMGIVIGIITLFIVLMMLGLFKVPIKWIRMMGFISFIFLFEFIIFLADTWIHHATHGEPLKVMGIKVVLIAMLLPLHHFLEHKVIHYLTHKWHIPPVETQV
jgi:tetratricopeptide (TPR) repeat protein